MANVKLEDVHPTFLRYIAIDPESDVFVPSVAPGAPNPSEPKENPPESYINVDVYAGRFSSFIPNDGSQHPVKIKTFVPFLRRLNPDDEERKHCLMVYEENEAPIIASYVSILSHVGASHKHIHAIDRWSVARLLNAFQGDVPDKRVLVLTVDTTIGRGEILSFAYHITVTTKITYPLGQPTGAVPTTEKKALGRGVLKKDVHFIVPQPGEEPPL